MVTAISKVAARVIKLGLAITSPRLGTSSFGVARGCTERIGRSLESNGTVLWLVRLSLARFYLVHSKFLTIF
jgi:hypothetical protein